MSTEQNHNGHSQSQAQQRHTQMEPSTEQNPANRPVEVLRDGALKASIWRNDSKNGPFFTTDFAKTYEDRSGNLKDGRSFSGTDLLRISELARQAYTISTDMRRQAAQEHGQGHAPDQDSQRAQFKDQRRTQQHPAPSPSRDS